MTNILRSPDERLRLLWRLLIYLVLYLIVAMGAQVVLPLFDPSGPLIVFSRLLFAAIYISATLVLTYYYRRNVDKKTWSGIGLSSLRSNWYYLIGGFLVYALIQMLFFGIDYVAGFIHVDGYEATDSGVSMSLIYLLAGLIYYFAIGFCEELAIRGYVFQNLGEHYPLWLVVLINAVLFASLHFLGGDFAATLAAVPMLITGTIFFIVLRLTTRSLWALVGLHTASNWFYFNVLGTFSGGQYGEGHALIHLTETASFPLWYSLLEIIIYVSMVLLLLLWSRRRGYPIDWRARLEDDGSIARQSQ